MSSITNFQLGAKYNFVVYPTVLGTFKNVKIEGFVDYATAGNYIDVPAMHANVFGSIPTGLCPNDPRQYNYLLIRLSNGTQTAIGLPWISESTIELVESKRCIIVLEDESSERASILRSALAAVGGKVTSIQFE